MQLTPHQEGLIAGYLREVSLLVDSAASSADREAGLRRIESELRDKLARLGGDGELNDETVIAAIRALGPAEEQARKTTLPKGAAGELLRATEDRVWLGVCAGWAHRSGIEPWIIRTAMIVVGICATPLAVLAYLGGYAELYIKTQKQVTAPPNYFQMALRGGLAFGAALLLFYGTGYFLDAVAWAYEFGLKRPLPSLGQWGWYFQRDDAYVFWAIVYAVPIAVLSGAPLSNGWDYSLKRLAQAILALYAVAICFGVAGILVGIILDVVSEFGGMPFELPFDQS